MATIFMKYRAKPIIFNPEMAKAVHEGRKTQTRRIVPVERYEKQIFTVNKDCFNDADLHGIENPHVTGHFIPLTEQRGEHCSGDLLWVKENFKILDIELGEACFVVSVEYSDGCVKNYNSDDFHDQSDLGKYLAQAQRFKSRSKKGHWCPSIHMPRWASRTTIVVKKVRVERVQSISEADALAEGVGKFDEVIGHPPLFMDYVIDEFWLKSASESFKSLFMQIYGIKTMMLNPFVWVYEFEKVGSE